MLRGISILSKVALATAIGGAVPLFSGSISDVPPSIIYLQPISEPLVFEKAYGLSITKVPAVPEHLQARPQEKSSAPRISAPSPHVCPFDVRAIIAAIDGGNPFAVLEYKGESSVLRVGEKIRAGSRFYRLSRIKIDHLILRHLSGDISQGGQRSVRCSLQ